MPENISHVERLPVMELTPRGEFIVLGHAYDVTLQKRPYGRGFRYTGQCQRVELAEPGVPVEVTRWQSDRIIVRRIARD